MVTNSRNPKGCQQNISKKSKEDSVKHNIIVLLTKDVKFHAQKLLEGGSKNELFVKWTKLQTLFVVKKKKNSL